MGGTQSDIREARYGDYKELVKSGADKDALGRSWGRYIDAHAVECDATNTNVPLARKLH